MLKDDYQPMLTALGIRHTLLDRNKEGPGVRLATMHRDQGAGISGNDIGRINAPVMPLRFVGRERPHRQGRPRRTGRSLLFVAATRAQNLFIVTSWGSPGASCPAKAVRHESRKGKRVLATEASRLVKKLPVSVVESLAQALSARHIKDLAERRGKRSRRGNRPPAAPQPRGRVSSTTAGGDGDLSHKVVATAFLTASVTGQAHREHQSVPTRVDRPRRGRGAGFVAPNRWCCK